MRISDQIGCQTFPCCDVNTSGYLLPPIEVDPGSFSVMMISESSPGAPHDYYYAAGHPAFEQTTVTAFNDAGIQVSSIQDILNLGIYLTTALKCGKIGYGIETQTVRECSFILEEELALLPNIRACLLMGDIAIKALNTIARRLGEPRVIPAGSTYKLRGQPYYFRGIRTFPSYLQVGPSFNIEKSKRRMIAEDIAAALKIAAVA